MMYVERINTNSSSTKKSKSILVLGASGRTGVACILALADNQNQPKIHAFCRDRNKMPLKAKAGCDSFITGDARNAADLEKAIVQSRADVVIVSLGNGDNVKKCDIRTESAKALVQVLKRPEHGHVRTIVVSSSGAGTSRIVVGMGMGKLIMYHLRHILHDHNGQEQAFLEDPDVAQRTTIVRPTALTEDKPTHKLLEVSDTDPLPCIKTDRADLANWIVNEIFSPKVEHRIVNVTGSKK